MPTRMAAPLCLLLASTLCGEAETQPILTFNHRPYYLGSFNQTPHPMWEFVPNGEVIDHWTNLVTIIDRPDARTLPDLDKLAEGIMSTYKNAGAKILMAKSMQNRQGATFNYLLAAFEEPAQHRFELNFVKIALGSKNAYTMICGVRIADPKDYKTRAADFLEHHSGEVGQALGEATPPDLTALPRKVF